MKIPAAAFTAANKLGRMAGDIFRGAKGVAQSGVLLPVAATAVPMAIGGVHGRIAGHSNPGHSGLPGALGYGALVNPLAGIGYYAGQRSASGNRNQEALESLESLQNYLSAINPNMLQVPGNI